MQLHHLRLIVLLIFSVLTLTRLNAQKTYEFNSNASPCFLSYVVYTNTEYAANASRPIIFILGRGTETAMEIFNHDTLRFAQPFFTYRFVYVPRYTAASSSSYPCLSALSSLLSYPGSATQNNNLFVYLNDPTTNSTNVPLDWKATFKSISYNDQSIISYTSDGNKSTGRNIVALADSFKEEYTLDQLEEGESWVNEGTESDTPPQPKKLFTGPPTERNITISGMVRDIKTGEALPSATIQVKGTGIGTATNMDGYFVLQKIPTDTSTLIVNYIGYQTTEIFLTPSTQKTNLIVGIYPSTRSLKTVTIVGMKEDIVLSNNKDVSLIKMTPKKLESLPNLGEKDVMRAFQLMPGVSASNESSSGLYVRGGTPDQNLILYDGFTVYHVDHLYGFFSAFNANALKDVQLYKGGFESRFGGRLSSVTEITGKEGNSRRFNIGGDLSLLSMNAYVEMPIGKKFTSVIAFRKSYKGPIYNKIFKKFNTGFTTSAPRGPGGTNVTSTITSYFYDLNGKFTFKPNDKDIYSLSFFNGTDKLDNSQDASSSGPPGGGGGGGFGISTTDLTKYGNIGSSLKWSRKIAPKLYSNTILSYSNYYSKRDRSQDGTITTADGEEQTVTSGIFENNDLRDYSLKNDWQWDLTSWNQIQMGLFGTYYDVKYTYAQNDTLTILDKHQKSTTSGAYIQSRIKLFKEKLQLVPGYRFTNYAATQQWYYEPRFTAIYHLNDKLSLKGATGRYYQFANRVTREDILSGSRDFWILSDGEKVPVGRADHFIAGLSYDTKDYLFSVEGYYKELAGLSEYSLRINSNPFNVNYNENFLQGTGRSRGVEFLAQRKSGALNGWASYTLGRTRYQFDAYGSEDFAANQDVTHEFKAVAIYKYKRWDFSATWIYATGRPYTAPSGAYSITLLDGSEKEYFTVTSKNSLRLSDYHRCDISASYKLIRTDGKKKIEIGSIGCSIFNLYNRKNVWYKQFSIVDGDIIETNVHYLGFTPNLTLTLKLH